MGGRKGGGGVYNIILEGFFFLNLKYVQIRPEILTNIFFS